MNISAPAKSEYPEFHSNYIGKVTGNDLLTALKQAEDNLVNFIRSLPAEKIDYRYAPGKWTIREVLQHIIDAERIFAYRALRLSRMDPTPLPGWDENQWALHDGAAERRWKDLVQEFI